MRGRVQLKPLTLIRILRPLLIGRRLQSHLTECALYEIVDRGFEPWLPPLNKRNVLGLTPLGYRSGPPKFVHPGTEWII